MADDFAHTPVLSDLTPHRSTIAELREPWQVLATRCGSVFSTWEWASTWWEHAGAGREQAITAWFDAAGDVVAIVPCYVWARRPTRVLRLIGHGPADLLEPLVRPDLEHLAPALVEASLRLHRSGLFFGEELPQQQGWVTALAHATRHRAASIPLLPLTPYDAWDDYLATLKKKLRHELRQSARILAERGATFRLAQGPDRLDADLNALFRLHRLRFDDTQSGSFAGMESFHRAFARIALERGWLRLWLLELDGEAIAAWYGFRYGDCDWFYQTGRDPQWDHLAVGKAVIARTIRAAIEDGVPLYSFGRGEVPYKRRLATGAMGFEAVLVPSGWVGRGAVLAARVIRRSSVLKRLLRGPLDA